MSAALARTIDWNKVLARSAPEFKKMIMETRAKHQDLKSKITDIKQSMPKFDFKTFESILPQEMIQEQQRILSVLPKKKDSVKEILALEELEAKSVAEARAELKKIEEKMVDLQVLFEKLQNAKPVQEMTLDDVYHIYPEFREEFMERIRQDNWTVSDPNPSDVKEVAHEAH